MTVKIGNFENLWSFNSVVIGWIAVSIICDIVITATLTMILVCSPTHDLCLYSVIAMMPDDCDLFCVL